MNLSFPKLLQGVIDTLRDPREGARKVIALRIERRQRWEILLLIVVLSAVLAQLTFLIAGSGGASIAGPFPASPFTLGIVQLLLLLAMVGGIHVIGRRAGGTGRLDDAILLVAWLQFIMICLQVLQTAALFLLPPLSLLIGIAGLVLFFWLLTNFIAELHGFKSLTAILVGIMISMVAFAILLSILLGLSGVFLPEVS